MIMATNHSKQDEIMSNKGRKPKKRTPKPVHAPGPKPHAKTCSFCNKHQKNTPLMVMSPVTNACVCAYCAMNVVEQTMHHMVNVSSAFNQVVQNKPEWFDQDQETGAITFIDPEKELDKIVGDANGEEE
jgi:transcription elongation factor Elf1